VSKKINKRIILKKKDNPSLYQVVDNIYRQYVNKKNISVTIKTFCKIKQVQYKSGDQIDINKK
jgi:hypothetical protein